MHFRDGNGGSIATSWVVRENGFEGVWRFDGPVRGKLATRRLGGRVWQPDGGSPGSRRSGWPCPAGEPGVKLRER
jgi:hypothetical protein